MQNLESSWKCEVVKAQNGFIVRYAEPYDNEPSESQLQERVFQVNQDLEYEEDEAGEKQAFAEMCWFMAEHFAVGLNRKYKKHQLVMEVQKDTDSEDAAEEK